MTSKRTHRRPCAGAGRRSGFTLLEVLVALALLVTAFAIVWSTFTATVGAWERGREVLATLHRGGFILDRFCAALRSAAYVPERGELFGFRLDDRGGARPADRVSWVTAHPAFVPPGAPEAAAPHRLELSVAPSGPDGRGLEALAYPYLAERDAVERLRPLPVSRAVRGLNIRIYDPEEETWSDTWANTNDLPRYVEVTLFFEGADGAEQTLQRLVEIPLAARAAPGASRPAPSPAPREGGP